MQCPHCSRTVTGITTRGPSDHFLAPCGCRVSTLTAHDLAGNVDRGRGVATDGGQEMTEWECGGCGERGSE